MRLLLVLGAVCASASSLRLHQHAAGPSQCVDLQCPATSFDYGKKRLVNEETLSSEPCRNCQQCTAAGYSVCLRPRILNRSKRDSSQQISTCSCAHSVPANCHNEVSKTTHPGNITMHLYNVCYASALQSPGVPLATNSKKNVIVTVEPFWEEPYWKDLDLENLTLFYSFEVKRPEHCEGDIVSHGEFEHVCTANIRVGMSTEDRTGEEEYEHSETYHYEDDLPPEVEFDRDVFLGAKNVNFTYKVAVRRPRQLRIREGSSDVFEDIVTVVDSEPLIHDMKSEIYGTGLEGTDLELNKETAQAAEDKTTGKPEDEDKKEDTNEIEPPAEDEKGVSEEEGEAPENLPGTDFFDDTAKESKELTDEEKKEEEEDEKQFKEDEELEKQLDKEGEKATEEGEHDESSEKPSEEEIDLKPSIHTEIIDAAESTTPEVVEETTTPKEEAETKEETDASEERAESTTELGSGSGSGSGSDEDDDGVTATTEAAPGWADVMRDFFIGDSRMHLARWVFAVTIIACLLLICLVCVRRRCTANSRRQQKSNGVRYEPAGQANSRQLVSPERMHLNQ